MGAFDDLDASDDVSNDQSTSESETDNDETITCESEGGVKRGTQLSENVAEDVVHYLRSKMVGHEEQGLLMYYSVLTGWVYERSCHNNVIGMGPPGSGKSLCKNTISEIVPDEDQYTKTEVTPNALLDSDDWDYSIVAVLDEYDKTKGKFREVLKSSNPEDNGYSKDRSVEDDSARSGYSPESVSAAANPWVLLYAPTSKKGSVDSELKDRALVLYFSNDKKTRRAIGRKEFGHENVDIESNDVSYIYDAQETAVELREHIASFDTRMIYEEYDDEPELDDRRGDTPVYEPKWIWYALEPIFDFDADETNRVYGLVMNCIKASALDNIHNRNTIEREFYVDDDSTTTERREAVVIASQDVANVMVCLPTLLSTTHDLTPLKRNILDAVDATSISDDGGTTVQQVRDWLKDNDIPHPSEQKLRDEMKELSQNYYLHQWEDASSRRGNPDLYERRDKGVLQTPRTHDLTRYADQDGEDIDEDCIECDPDRPFEDSHDPIRDQDFEVTVQEFDAKFTGESVDEPSTDASNFMSGPDDSESSDTQASLTDVDDSGVEATSEPTIEPDGEPEGVIEQFVYENAEDSELFAPTDEIGHYLGVHDRSSHSTDVDFDDTVFDPEHEFWEQSAFTDDRVVSEIETMREFDEAYHALLKKGVIVEDTSSGPEGMFVLRTADL